MPEIVVQRVTTTWTKESRGGAAAAFRNQCPVAFQLPGEVGWHAVEMAEDAQFEPVHEFAEEVPPAAVDELGLRVRDGRLSVLPRVSAFWMPKRHRRPPRRSIAPGEWARWTVNYRLGLDRGWAYGLVTWSFAFRVDPADRRLFSGDPPHSTDELAPLR